MSGQPSLVLYGVVAIFLAIMLGVGIVAKRFVTDSDDFHQGGGRVPWWVAGTSIYMGTFSAFAFVSFGSVVFTDGGVGLLLGYGTVIGFVIAGLFFAHRWHRAGLVTPVAYLAERFGPSTHRFVAVVTLITSAISSALRLYAFAVMANGLMGVPIVPTIIVSGSAMATVAITGGLWGIVLADAVQFVILLAGLVPLLVMSIIQFGGFDAFWSFATTDMLAFDRGTKDWGWLLSWWLFLIVTANFSLPAIQRFASVPTEQDARKAAFLAAALLIPTPFLALIPVAICFELFPGTPPELAFATIAREVLPVGLLGLMVGAMIAATVSELETSFNIDSGIVTRDLYQRSINPRASARRLLWLGRVATFGSASVAILLALALATSGTGIFAFSEAIGSRVTLALCIPFIVGIIVPRVSERAFFFTIAISLSLSLVLWWSGVAAGDVRLPLAGAGLVAVALGALVFPPRGSEAARVTAFFERQRAPHPAGGGRPGVDSATVRIVGATIALMALVPFALPSVAGTTGPAQWVEYGTAAALFAIGGALLLARRALASDRAGASA